MSENPRPQPAPSPAPADRVLAARAQQGDGEALGLLYDRHVDFVHRYLLRSVRGDVATAEDLVHDTFIRVIRAFDDGQFDTEREEAFRGWLTRIATNVCRSHYRRQASRPALEEPMPRHDEMPEEEPMAPWSPDPLAPIELDALIDQLPPQSRRVMRFRRHHPDLTEAECAERLELSVEAYRKSVRRSFARLRELAAGRRDELMDATYPWQNRGAETAAFVPERPATGAERAMDPAARARVRAAVLAAHAALARQG